jgi:hypothetical protein
LYAYLAKEEAKQEQHRSERRQEERGERQHRDTAAERKRCVEKLCVEISYYKRICTI